MTSTLSSVELPRERAVSERGFLAASALLFVTSAAATVAWCRSMSAMNTMPMGWMPMCGQTWLTFGASFIGMWAVMMVAMMLPSLLPMLRQYRVVLRAAGTSNLDALTALAGTGYFAIWSAIGVAVFALGAALAAVEMTWPTLLRAAPAATGVIVVAAGVLQISVWKARQLAQCREALGPGNTSRTKAGAAWQYGLHMGMRCARSCAGLTAMLLMMGVMDLRTMAAVSVAIALERLAPNGEIVARSVGAMAIAAGLLLTLRSACVT
ncbi:membrane protein [Ralstonia sp. A12]|uniref:DUF2182 domain-containing protein n=1 Tax=Ralstonia sp. A12 TaxID=1217052 RepID=UPI0005734E04|nr:DUF2182 domain-containing protein [Ralstonia sp. A12]KHK58378.1 membrane protein [Ralstonia sp. A12]